MITKALWQTWIPIVPPPKNCDYGKFANARAAVWLSDNLRSEQNWLKSLRVMMVKHPNLKGEIVRQIKESQQRIADINERLRRVEINELGSHRDG